MAGETVLPTIPVRAPVRYQFIPWHQLYAVSCLPDAEWQRCKLESLRYRYGHYKDAPEAAMMRTIRIVAKRYLPVLYAARALRGFF